MINSFQLMTVTEDNHNRKLIVMYMVINGKSYSCTTSFPNNVEKDDLYRCFLQPTIESLLDQVYPDF